MAFRCMKRIRVRQWRNRDKIFPLFRQSLPNIPVAFDGIVRFTHQYNVVSMTPSLNIAQAIQNSESYFIPPILYYTDLQAHTLLLFLVGMKSPLRMKRPRVRKTPHEELLAAVLYEAAAPGFYKSKRDRQYSYLLCYSFIHLSETGSSIGEFIHLSGATTTFCGLRFSQAPHQEKEELAMILCRHRLINRIST